MVDTKYLIIIAGPTAVGKTELSIKLARQFDAEIISSDSRQYYKELHIGTAKPTIEQMSEIPHHFVDSLSIHDDYSIGQFERDVISFLDEVFRHRNMMVMTGGSGMHIRAITHGLDEFPEVPAEVRNNWESVLHDKGIKHLQSILIDKDPLYAKTVDLDNPRRLIRALSVIDVGKRPYSAYLNQSAKSRNFKPIFILLERDRNELYDRINTRVESMFNSGLIQEVETLLPFRHKQALNTIGYKELFDFLEGTISMEEAKRLIKRNTRRYAKRQLTWFRKESYWNRFSPHDFDRISKLIADTIEQKTKGASIS